MSYRFLLTRRDGPIAYVTLNRPEVRNALNTDVISELGAWAAAVERQTDIRVAVLSGAGPVFCAGADIGWMAKSLSFTVDENTADAERLAAMLAALNRLRVPLIGRIHGAALGGGSGLAAICDIVVAAEDAVFGFTEVKLGIVPAVISPFVLAKIGRSAARELFLTGARFDATRAREIGVVHAVVPSSGLDDAVLERAREVLSGGPDAIATTKALISQVWDMTPKDAARLTARTIAMRRVSPEGQEGLRAFLEKRRASWRGDE
ncbi:MAG: enoyl-CoA hydratase-related protein [Vicinamibacterales bacterium]